MAIIRPRLNDFHGPPFTQAEVDFAIPYLDEDLPLFLDPFLLWRSPSLQDKALHTTITNSFNHLGYGMIEHYVKEKERTQADCRNDPLFSPIPVLSVKRKLLTIQKLPSGTKDAADKKYEDAICQLMASLLYPQLDFAADQSRTDSGAQIRDLIFYNNRSYDFLKDIYDEYACRQMVVELKNVREIEREHINQVNRYLKDQFGQFGIIVTRNPPPRQMFRNTVDLWAGQRRCVLILDDSDVAMMCQLYESRQRLPIDVIKKKYVEFTRACPG